RGTPALDEFLLRVNPIAADHQIICDVVQRDIDLLQRNAETSVVGKAVQRELQHPLVLLGSASWSLTGFPIYDLDTVTAVFPTIDRVEFADHDVPAEGEVDLDLDGDGFEVAPLAALEDLTQSLEICLVGSRDAERIWLLGVGLPQRSL